MANAQIFLSEHKKHLLYEKMLKLLSGRKEKMHLFTEIKSNMTEDESIANVKAGYYYMDE